MKYDLAKKNDAAKIICVNRYARPLFTKKNV